ncbi:MAG: DUF1592 domain-containing protein [Polyangiaceae bacterium]|nr:DUF1592 domain-containing protein [Polyangiaceae bacterium]
MSPLRRPSPRVLPGASRGSWPAPLPSPLSALLLATCLAGATLGGCGVGKINELGGGSGKPGASGGGNGGAGGANGGSSGTSGASGGDPGNVPPSFTCDPSLRGPELPLRRLSNAQYRNALRDLIEATAPGQSGALMAKIDGSLAKVPPDARKGLPNETHGGYRRLDQSVQQEHIDGTYRVAVELGAELASSAWRKTVVGECAVDADTSNDDACIDAFLRRVGERALRRPLSEEDLAFYREVYDAKGVNEQAIADALGSFMTSPEFLYHVEHGEGQVEGEVFRLSPWELASRLSFHFWQAPPDDELREAARDGSLASDAVYEAQVKRLAGDARARQSLDQFVSEWLWLDDLKELDSLVGTPVFDAFASGQEGVSGLRDEMVNEIADLGAYYAVQSDGTLEDLLTSRRSFARGPALASIYKVQPWDGAGEPPELPEKERVGLLTRAALLATGSANTRPIMKGVFLRKGLLCDAVPPPPNNAAAMPPKLSPEFTTREVVEALTEQDGTACALCHQTNINPLGFATENFDALGRLRFEQKLFDEQGVLLKSKAVDTSSIPQVHIGDMTPSSGAEDLTRLVVESGKPQACFVRNYFRFTFSRLEDTKADGCILEELRSQISGKAPLREVLARVAMTRSFRERSFAAVEGN